jgi:hypothetical protein
MVRFNSRILGVRVAALLCWSALAVACGSDDNHGPTIGAPTTTVPINEGGGSPGVGGTFSAGGTSAGGATNISGSTSTGGAFGASGATGVAGTFSSGGADPFGTGGAGTSDPFGSSGTTSSAAGTAPF